MSANKDRIARLREEIANDTLTYSEIERRLFAAIDAEYKKTDSDIQFINACQDLLWEIKTEGNQEFHSHNCEYLSAMNRRTKSASSKCGTRFVTRFAAVVAVFTAITLLAEVVFNQEWLTGFMTNNNQNYYIQGHKIDLGIINHSIAEHPENDYLITTDWPAAVEFLGFEPQIPNPKELDMELNQCSVFYSPINILLSVLYKNDKTPSNSLVYTVYFVTDIDDFILSFEQSSSEYIEKINDIDIHISENINSQTCTWIYQNTIHRLEGDIPVSSILTIVEALVGGPS